MRSKDIRHRINASGAKCVITIPGCAEYVEEVRRLKSSNFICKWLGWYVDNSDLGYFGPDSGFSCGQFGPWLIRSSAYTDPAKSKSELHVTYEYLKKRSELAKVRIGSRSELASVRIYLRSELTKYQTEIRSESANA